MSAGICIMNKNAIALAADSTVTIGQHLAIHNSANKLFALSKTAPIGVIIYANADFMHVPMEIILKKYKQDLGNTTFPSLQAYVENFFDYLTSHKTLFHFDINESKIVERIYSDLLSGLFGDYQQILKAEINKVKRELTEEETEKIASNAVDLTLAFVKQLKDLSDYDVMDYVREKYGESLHIFIEQKYSWIPANRIEDLCNAVYLVYNKQFFRSGYIGLAFAGYGEDCIFPDMIHLHMDSIINNQIRYVYQDFVRITEENPANITPLAQTDVMQTFLFGINDSFIGDIARELPVQIEESLRAVDDTFFSPGKKREVQSVLDQDMKNIINQIITKAQTQYLLPITQSVASLPIEELSLLAESMINITSLRRKVAIDNNIGTVGGPIDVAIISKSDGFVWLKRKHYFDSTYNPQYFYSHYLQSGGDTNEFTG